MRTKTRNSNTRIVENNLPSAQQFTKLMSYIRQVADLMCLKDWAITLSVAPAQSENQAEVVCTPGQKFATIYVNYGLFNETPEDIRYYVTHELTHLHFDQVEKSIIPTLKRKLKEEDFEIVLAHHVDAEENATDALATALAKHMPLPKL